MGWEWPIVAGNKKNRKSMLPTCLMSHFITLIKLLSPEKDATSFCDNMQSSSQKILSQRRLLNLKTMILQVVR
jgi:hypothetical protein